MKKVQIVYSRTPNYVNLEFEHKIQKYSASQKLVMASVSLAYVQFYINTPMVLILNGNLEHNAHAKKKVFREKSDF